MFSFKFIRLRATRHCFHTAGVTGSSPVPPTILILPLQLLTRDSRSPEFLVANRLSPVLSNRGGITESPALRGSNGAVVARRRARSA
jgi:hypothetical protein